VILAEIDGSETIVGELTTTDRAVLELASRWWRSQGSYERAIAATLGWSPVKYFQRLNHLLDDPAAAAAYPMTVARLRRIRAAAPRARAGVGDGTGATHP
jgi:hypothetical protein